MTLAEFEQRWGGCSAKVFLDVVRVPHLILPNLSVPNNHATFGSTSTKIDLKNNSGGEFYWVVPVSRRPSHTNPSMITLGRSADNDIVISHLKVSKHHAYFRWTPHGWTITDTESFNGTSVDGSILAPNRSYHLKPRSHIALARGGGVPLYFLDPQALYEDIVQPYRCSA